jgi:hypothetical protein
MSQLVELEPMLVKPLRSESSVRTQPRTRSGARTRPDAPARPSRTPEHAGLDPVLVTPLPRAEAPARKAPTAPPFVASPAMLRTAGILVAATVACTLAGRVATVAAAPLMATYRAGQEIGALQVELGRQGSTNAQLREDIKYLKTPEGIEQEARRRGWVKPGEVALSIVAADEPRAAARVAGAPAEAPVHQSVADRIRSAVDTCLAVLGSRARKH